VNMKTIAVLLGLLLSLINFAIFIALSAWALRRKTTTAFAITGAGFIVRLTLVVAVYVYFVSSSTWGPLIYWITAGFVPSVTVLLAIEIIVLMRMEKRLATRTTSETKAKTV
jgi:hypothetical protein